MGEVLWQLLNFVLLIGLFVLIIVLIISLVRFCKKRKEQIERMEKKINFIEEKIKEINS